MLKQLAIRDIVLVRRLELGLPGGLCVLTGETGAGKSILLDALGLALGGRADRALVRAGAEQASVAAWFEPPPEHPAWAMLAEQAILDEGEIVLRRTLAADGRSRAFVNDQPVTGQLLRRLGDSLVEVHGQNDQRGLLSPALHRELLDAFAGLAGELLAVAQTYRAWRTAVERADGLAAAIRAARQHEDELRHLVDELAALAVAPAEEGALAARRQRLLNAEKLVTAVAEASESVAGSGGARERLVAAHRRLDRVRSLAETLLDAAHDAIGRALVELDEAEAALATAGRALDPAEQGLEAVESRLFALRDAARKHRVPVDELPRVLSEGRAALAGLDDEVVGLAAARADVDLARASYLERATRLGRERAAAAQRLARAVMAELPPLKLERARFAVALLPLDEAEWGPAGQERVAFEVATNPGQPFGPLARIASGGELSRFMLALKVVLARIGAAETLVFDEIDAGIGGATADAVGERLARLAQERQVLIVTHAPQVAARASHHLTVRKAVGSASTEVEVAALGGADRELEIARMLAGAEVTTAARAAARSLLERA